MIATPGIGKTTLLLHALNQLRDKARTVFLFQTVSTSTDLLRALLTDLGVREPQGSLVEMQLRLKELLVEQARLGRRVVLAIDEAQNLDDSVLELVRMLSNFETSREKLMQIILCGQPQLADKIASPGLVQLRQRVSIFACLEPLSPGRHGTLHRSQNRDRRIRFRGAFVYQGGGGADCRMQRRNSAQHQQSLLQCVVIRMCAASENPSIATSFARLLLILISGDWGGRALLPRGRRRGDRKRFRRFFPPQAHHPHLRAGFGNLRLLSWSFSPWPGCS